MKKLRNILAMLMVFVMLVAVMPMNVFAEENTPVTTTEGQEEPAPAPAPGEGDGEGDQEEDPLKDARETAKKTVNGLENLTEEEKQPFIDAIKNASDKAGIDKAVSDAKAKTKKESFIM